jgi:hypothetical protein
MMMTVFCPRCRCQLKASQQLAGKVARCPSCAQVFAIATSRQPVAEVEVIEAELVPAGGAATVPASKGKGKPFLLESTDESIAMIDDGGDDPPEASRERGRPVRARRGALSNDYTICIGDWFGYALAHYVRVLGLMIAFELLVFAPFLLLQSFVWYYVAEQGAAAIDIVAGAPPVAAAPPFRVPRLPFRRPMMPWRPIIRPTPAWHPATDPSDAGATRARRTPTVPSAEESAGTGAWLLVPELAYALVVPVLSAGFVVVALAELKRRKWSFSDFFAGFRRPLPYLGLALLIALAGGMVLGPALLLGSFLLSAGAVRVSLALTLLGAATLAAGHLACFYVVVRSCFFAMPLMADRGFGPIEALVGSWTLSRGHVLALLAISLLFALINAGGAVLLGIGLLFTLPLVVLTWTSGYLLIAGSDLPVAR